MCATFSLLTVTQASKTKTKKSVSDIAEIFHQVNLSPNAGEVLSLFVSKPR